MEPLAPPDPAGGQYAVLSGMLEQGIDPSSLFQRPRQEGGGIRPGVAVPGFGRPSLRFSQEQLDEVARDYCEILNNYDAVMDGDQKVEEAIRAAYAQRTDSIHTGIRPGDANYCSEMTMTQVDQATARIFSNIIGVEPLARCIPIAGGEMGDLALETAQAAEHFLQNYGQRVVKLPLLLARAVHRACKVGTAVLKGGWVVENRRTFSYAADSDRAVEKMTQTGRVHFELPPNRLVKIWPPTIADWQAEYQLVGHDTWLNRGQLRKLAVDLKLGKETTERLLAAVGYDRDQGTDKVLREQDVNRQAQSHKSDETLRITELWCHDVLPGQSAMDKYQLFLCRDLRLVFWIDYNRLHTQGHPYFPLRYKLVDEFAWGRGIGHEVLFPQAAGTAMQNIRLDSLKASCYHFVVCKPDHVHEQQTLAPMHGQRVISETPTDDYIPRKLGGPLPEISEAIADIDFRGAKSSGMPPVLSGLGDPIQKSGTGATQTTALISEAGRKFGHVDWTLRNGLNPALQFILEQVAQSAPEGVLYEFANEEDAQKLSVIRWTPPRGEIAALYRIDVQAPNAATSRDGRRQAWLLLYQFLRDHLTMWVQAATQILQTENPAAITRMLHEVAEFQAWLAEQLVEDYDLAGAKDKIPHLPEMTPQDETINQLQVQISELQEQLSQVTAQAQSQMGGGAPQPPQMGEPMAGMPMPMNGGGMPEEGAQGGLAPS